MRRQVAFSRTVYEKRAVVEEMEAVLVKDASQMQQAVSSGKVAVIVDPEAKIREVYKPDVLVDAILAKRNTGTKKGDAPCVIGLGPGFCGGKDCYAALETMRGDTLGKILYDSTPIPNTGVPGVVGGYSIERLLKASGDGKIEPKAKIGDIVEKGQIVAYTGGKPVYAGVAGVVRGMLQAGINVKTGLKIGDVDPRKDISLVYKISDKSNLLGMQAYKAAEQYFCSQTGIVVLAAGRSSRYGENKLLAEVGGSPMFRHIFEVLKEFPMCEKVVSTRFPQIMKEAKEQGIAVAENQSSGVGNRLLSAVWIEEVSEAEAGCEENSIRGRRSTVSDSGNTVKTDGCICAVSGKDHLRRHAWKTGKSGAVGSEIFSGASEIRRGHRWQADYEKISG